MNKIKGKRHRFDFENWIACLLYKLHEKSDSDEQRYSISSKYDICACMCRCGRFFLGSSIARVLLQGRIEPV